MSSKKGFSGFDRSKVINQNESDKRPKQKKMCGEKHHDPKDKQGRTVTLESLTSSPRGGHYQDKA